MYDRLLLFFLLFGVMPAFAQQKTLSDYKAYVREHAVYDPPRQEPNNSQYLQDHLLAYWSDGAITAVRDTTIGDSTFITYTYADGTVTALKGKWSGHNYTNGCLYYREAGQHYYYHLETKKRLQSPTAFLAVYFYNGTFYTFGTRNEYNVIKDDTGRILKTTQTAGYFAAGFLIEQNYSPEEGLHQTLTHLETGKVLKAGAEDKIVLYEGDQLFCIRDSTGNETYYNHRGDSLFSTRKVAGRTGKVTTCFAPDLLRIGYDDDSESLMDVNGKILATTAMGQYMIQDFSNCFNLGWKTGYGIYDKATGIFTIFPRSEIEPIDRDRFLVRQQSSYKVVNSRAETISDLETSWAHVRESGEARLLVGSVPETDPAKKKAKLKELNRFWKEKKAHHIVHDEVGITYKPDPDAITKAVYFDRNGQPLEFPEDCYIAYISVDGPYFLFNTFWSELYGVVDETGRVLVPQNYLYIEYYAPGKVFIALDASEQITYIRME